MNGCGGQCMFRSVCLFLFIVEIGTWKRVCLFVHIGR